MPGTWYNTSTHCQVLLCTCFVLQRTTFFASSYSYYEPHRVSWAEFREDLYRRKAFQRTARMSEGNFVTSLTCYAQLSKRTSAKRYLVLHTWHLIYEYQVLLLCTCFVFQGATFCDQLLVRERSRRCVGIVSHLQ